MSANQVVLFLCTGNYYRSRYAEILFNIHASTANLPWKATSRGFRLNPRNIGPIAPCVIDRLASLKLSKPTELRSPITLQETDLSEAKLIIALDQTEHPSHVQKLPSQWHDKIVYWNVPDIDRMPIEEALKIVEKEVTQLLKKLA